MEKTRIINEISKCKEYYLDVLEDVCNIESPTNYKEGVDNVGKYFLDMANKMGWETEVFKQEISGDVIMITMNSDSAENPVILSGHMDTVHPVGLFGTPAVRRDDEFMYGPGVMDCKGGIVGAFMAMDVLSKCGYKKRPVRLILQSDEENSSATSNKETVRYMCDKSKGAIAFLNLEGIEGNTAVIKRKGILKFLFKIRGVAMHASRCCEGSNAVLEAAHKIIKLEKMKNPEGITCNCGVINGGTTINTVAEECNFYADIRFSTEEEMEKARKTVKVISDEITVKGCSCECVELSVRPAMELTDKNIELLRKMNDIYKEWNLPILEGRAELSGSDAAYITQINIPCVDNLGTDGSDIHSVREKIRLNSLEECAKRIASVVYSL